MDRYLQVFVTVAEKRSFSRAAEEHHMTQPAVSQYIRIFEKMMGERLLERNNKYVRLNQAGHLVYDYAKEILGLYSKMGNMVNDLKSKASGPLSIGASYTFGEYVLPKIIANLLERYPDIQPSITIGNTTRISELVAKHQIDIGIVEGHIVDESLIEEAFAEDQMVVVASCDHHLARKEEAQVKIGCLANETWIIREGGSGTREITDHLFNKFNITPKKCMYFNSTQSIKGSVEAGLGISLLSRWTIQKKLENGDLKIVRLKELPLQRKFSMITSSSYRTKTMKVFMDLMRICNH